nr:MAG TPA: hypothetical protein [Caudoviricetes sp.]
MVVILASPLLEWWLFWRATFCSLVVNQDLHLNRIHVKTSSPCPFLSRFCFTPYPREILSPLPFGSHPFCESALDLT